MLAAGLLQAANDQMKDFYVLRNMGEYSESMGLNLSVEYGRAVMM